MFVENCDIKSDQVLKTQDASEKFSPVCCAGCATEIAVFDQDEVFHFFNVVSEQVMQDDKNNDVLD